MRNRWRWWAGAAVAALACWASASSGQKPEVVPAAVEPAKAGSEFVKLSRNIIRKDQIDWIEVVHVEGKGELLRVYLIGRPTGVAQAWAHGDEGKELLRSLGLPPIEADREKP